MKMVSFGSNLVTGKKKNVQFSTTHILLRTYRAFKENYLFQLLINI